MIHIRAEEERDHFLVEKITREAFWNLYCPGCSEHFIAHQLRNHDDFIAELTFVIELNGVVAGSIFYSHSKVIGPDNQIHKTITFGPVSILPKFHRRGLGRALISHSIKEAQGLGHRAIIIGGYPHHYQTYGFIGAKKYGLSMPDGQYYTGIMALPLYDGALNGIKGQVHFSPAMMDVDPAAVDEFDKKFPPADKLITASQREFEAAFTNLDEQNY